MKRAPLHTILLIALITTIQCSSPSSVAQVEPSIQPPASTNNGYVAPDPTRYENEILAYEQQDALAFPPEGATLFIGSSSIRMWNSIAIDFPGLVFINRGFGGSQIADVLYYFNRIVVPYKPARIVYFAGTNDIDAGSSPALVVANTEEFIKRVNSAFPQTQIFILSNTIAVVRKHLHAQFNETNRLLQEMIKNYPNTTYVDVTTPGLTSQGKPRPEIYTSDSLHLNRTGYNMWKEILTPYLR